jgi:ABC-2 type transport system ATP-binding protein
LGVNGAGKSTLLKVAVGELAADEGAVHVQPDSSHDQLVGYCPQEIALPGSLRVREFLEYLAWLRKIPASRRRKVADDALEWAALNDRAGDRIGSLSEGMKRRLLIGQALMAGPSIVLLDEPTTGLDPEQRVRIRELLMQLPSSVSVLLSSHLIEDLVALCTRSMIIDGGELRGDIDMIGQDSKNVETLFLQTISRS